MRKNHPEKEALLNKVDWDGWLKKPGMPPVPMPFDQTLNNQCKELAKRWEACRNAPQEAKAKFRLAEFDAFKPDQKVAFLEQLLSEHAYPHSLLEALEDVYKLFDVTNSEIKFKWQRVCLKAGYEKVFPHVVAFLEQQGRMKFVRPLYRDLFHSAKSKQLALDTFKRLRLQYHPIASQQVAKDLGLTPKA
jgi:leukotriene-A4 hydrolase